MSLSLILSLYSSSVWEDEIDKLRRTSAEWSVFHFYFVVFIFLNMWLTVNPAFVFQKSFGEFGRSSGTRL